MVLCSKDFRSAARRTFLKRHASQAPVLLCVFFTVPIPGGEGRSSAGGDIGGSLPGRSKAGPASAISMVNIKESVHWYCRDNEFE